MMTDEGPTEEEIAAEGREIAANPFGRHEAYHTASLVLDIFDRNVLSHPAIEYGDDELRAAAQTVYETLADFYQLCGEKFLEDAPTDEAANEA
jgi:hypothetical protein